MIDRKIKGKAVIEIKAEKLADSIKINAISSDNQLHENKLIIYGKESIENHIGKSIGPGNWFFITQKMINDFAATTQDFQWVHIDEAKQHSTFQKEEHWRMAILLCH